MDDNNLQGNLSTIVSFLFVIITPYVLPYLEQFGISQTMFNEFVWAVIGVIIIGWSAYNPNTFKFLNNHKTDNCTCEMETEEKVLNDEYEDGC